MEQVKEQKKDALRWLLGVLIFVLVILFVFGFGVFVGQKKAKFSYRWAQEYHKMFGGTRHGFFPPGNFAREEFLEPHGVVGEIIKLENGHLIIRGRGNVERLVLFGENVIIKKGREDIKKEDLKEGDFVVVIGKSTDKGETIAQFIRVFSK